MKTIVAGRWNRHSSNREAAKRLWSLRNKLDKGEVPTSALKSAENDLIKVFVKELEVVGADYLSDGGIRWDSIYDITRYIGGCRGFSQLSRIPETNQFHRQPVAQLPFAYEQSIFSSDLLFIRTLTDKPVVICLPGPYTLAKQTQNVSEIGLERLSRAYAAILNWEAGELISGGAAMVRFEEPQMPDRGEDFVIFWDLMKELTRGLDDSKVALAQWYKPIKEPAYFELPFGNFFVDFIDGYRSIEMLGDFPRGKKLIAGLVDARHTRLETYDEILTALQKIAAYIPAENIYLGGNTDFHFLPWENALEKIRRLVEVGRRSPYV